MLAVSQYSVTQIYNNITQEYCNNENKIVINIPVNNIFNYHAKCNFVAYVIDIVSCWWQYNLRISQNHELSLYDVNII